MCRFLDIIVEIFLVKLAEGYWTLIRLCEFFAQANYAVSPSEIFAENIQQEIIERLLFKKFSLLNGSRPRT